MEVIAEALAKHQLSEVPLWDHVRHTYRNRCVCGAVADYDMSAHQAAVIAALPSIAIVELPKPEDDDTVHPYWAVEDVSGPQIVRTTDADGSVEGDWVNIEFTARWRTVDRETAQALGVALLAAASAAGGES